MAITKITGGGITADSIDGTKIADDAINSEHLTDGGIDDVHIGDVAATKLTGTIADARLPATLPAKSGVNLTALNATELTSGTIPIARIADDAVTNAKMADDAIDSAQIAAGAVDDAHLATGISASKLTGALPAISGANLTNLTSTFAGLTDTTVSTSDPASNSNPSATGHLWVNKNSGESYVCTDATNNANGWINIGGGSGDIGPEYVAATGGTVTTDGDYKVHVFNSSGTFTVTDQGNASGSNTITYLVLAGGGGAGGAVRGGGGGAGGYRSNYATSGGGASAEAAMAVPSIAGHSVTVGAGGSAGLYTTGNTACAGTAGGNSVFNGITSLGGGWGGGSDHPKSAGFLANTEPGSGGSGGGAFYGYSDNSPQAGTSGQGYAAGQSGATAPYGSGGGGAAEEGFDYNDGTYPCRGGNGLASTITGSSVNRGGGGASATYPNQGSVANVTGRGYDYGGGMGKNNVSQASGASADANGDANTGGGGGASGNGGSGVVIIRYKFQ